MSEKREPLTLHGCMAGFLIKEPSPTVLHQRVSARLQRVLHDYFQSIDPEGEVLCAPLDVVISDKTIVQPDLLYIAGSDQEALKAMHIFVIPRLIIEILSPGTRRKDRLQKMEIYRRQEWHTTGSLILKHVL